MTLFAAATYSFRPAAIPANLFLHVNLREQFARYSSLREHNVIEASE